VRLFGPEALVARLDRRLPLLTGGPRDAPARQRTLRDAISWSHDLLEEPERVLFRRLAVFAGGWSFEAAESVADLGDGLDVFGGLASLVDKSLVHRPGGGTRFGMLETIREFAEERLAESGEAEAVREAHAAHVLAFAERAGPEKLSPDVKARRREWDAELANLRAVLAWLERRRDADGMLRLAAAFADSAIARGQHQEALGWLERALSLGGPAPARLQALFWAAAIAALQGDPARNASWGEEGLDLSRRHGDAAWEGRLLYALELGAWTAGNFDAAVRWGEVAVERLRAQGDRLWLAYALGDLGTALVHRGEAERGVRAFDEGAAQHRAVGNGVGLGIQTADLAFLLATGDPTATRHLRESVRLLAAAGDRWWLAGPLAGLARRAADADRPASAARLLGASGRLLAESGADNRTPQERAEDERTAARARAGLGEPGFARELAAGQALPLEDAVAAALDLADELESGSD
jgi:tetratricopeptide (TPR) repeat protein